MAENIDALAKLLGDKTPEEQELLKMLLESAVKEQLTKAQENKEIKEEKKPKAKKVKEKDLTLEETIKEEQKRTIKKVVRATNKEWKEVVRSEHVVTADKKLQSETRSTKTVSDLNDLMDSAVNGTVLSGTIIGISSIALDDDQDKDGSKAKALAEAKARNANTASDEELRKYGDGSSKNWVADVQFGKDTCKVVIPSYELFPYSIAEANNPEIARQIHTRMSDMIGTEIRFIVINVNKAKKLALASRLKAMERDGYINYEYKRKDNKPRINVGDIAEAKIVCVRNKSLVVEIMGAETTLVCNRDRNTICWDFIADCHDRFRPNQIYPVKINAIETVKHRVYTRNYTLRKVQASMKDVTPNPMEVYWDSIEVGEIGLATITHIKDGKVFCKYKNRVDILCKAPEHGFSPYVGEQRKVEITQKQDYEGVGKRIFGVFRAD